MSKSKNKGGKPAGWQRDDLMTSRHLIHSLKHQADQKRTASDKFADWITAKIGTMGFLLINIVLFAVWLILNINILPGVVAFDPFPFGLLTTIVSLEAIILAIFVLISQNRAEKVDELRQEVDLQVDLIAEEELTKLLHIVTLLAEKQGVDLSKDTDLQAMLAPTNVEKLESVLEEQIVNTESQNEISV